MPVDTHLKGRAPAIKGHRNLVGRPRMGATVDRAGNEVRQTGTTRRIEHRTCRD
jgi:hypothetical protein